MWPARRASRIIGENHLQMARETNETKKMLRMDQHRPVLPPFPAHLSETLHILFYIILWLAQLPSIIIVGQLAVPYSSLSIQKETEMVEAFSAEWPTISEF